MIGYKNNGLKVKDIDEQGRKVLIYVSAFDNKDSDGDVIVKGAYLKTISERGPKSMKPRIKHLRDHWDLVGKPEEMTEDNTGLLVLSQVSKSRMGQDLIEDYKLDLFEHSIGFEIIQKEKSGDIQYLKELKLWEYSSVTWGANENTPMVAMKGFTDDYLSRLNARVDKLTNAIKSGNYSDERFEDLEYQLQAIKKMYNEVIESLQPVKTTEQPIIDLKGIGEIFDSFKSKI